MCRLTITLALAVLFPICSWAATYLIKPDGTGDFPTIQMTFSGVADGDTILLQDGIYQGPGNRGIDCHGRLVVLRSESGNPEDCMIDCQSLDRAFLIDDGEGRDLVIEGITMANGLVQWYGGAVWLMSYSSPTFRDCIFKDNVAGSCGGGLYCENCRPYLSDCVFQGNRSENQQGGGMSSTGYPSPTLLRCVFIENEAWMAGDYDCYGNSFVELTECEFYGNTSELIAGGFKATGTDFGDPVLRDCIFVGNSSEKGGGMSVAKVTAENCLFFDNSASVIGGGAHTGDSDAPEAFINCTFAGNAALYLGGLACAGSNTAVEGCTFYGNSAMDPGACIGTSGGGSITVERSIISYSGGSEVVHLDGGSITLSCCDVYGNEGGDWVGPIADQYGIDGNISENPLFCAPASQDFHLHTDSPCASHSAPNPECDLIGAWPVGCNPAFAQNPPTRPAPTLRLCSPNPALGDVRFAFRIDGEATTRTQLGVFDSGGRLVRALRNELMLPGQYQVVWDRTDAGGSVVPSGTYYCVLRSSGALGLQRVVVLR